MNNKYDYYRIIQGNYGYGWDDEDAHECDSTGFIRNTEARNLLRENLRLYRENGGGLLQGNIPQGIKTISKQLRSKG